MLSVAFQDEETALVHALQGGRSSFVAVFMMEAVMQLG